jgi:hypothetical protein
LGDLVIPLQDNVRRQDIYSGINNNAYALNLKKRKILNEIILGVLIFTENQINIDY